MLVLIDRVDNEIHVSVPFALKERVKSFPGYRWEPALKVWVFAYSDALQKKLESEFGQDAMFSGFDPPEPSEPQGLEWGASNSNSILRADIKVLKENLLASRDRIEQLEKELAREKSRVQNLIASEAVLTPSELEFLRAHRKLVLEQSRKGRPISW